MIPPIQVEPIQAHGKWWLEVTIGDQKLLQKKSYATADAAKAAAEKLLQAWTPNLPASTSKDFVVLHGREIALDSDEGRRFVSDCTKSAEQTGAMTDADIIDRWEISTSEWEALKSNVKLGRLIREEGRRRTASGARTRAAAQHHFTKSPDILDKIQSSAASPRHVVEAIRELRAISSSGDESPAAASELFSIVFHLGSDIERIDKVVTPKPPQIEGEIDAEQ